MRHYTELCIECANDEMAEIITAFLADYPFESFDTDTSAESTTLRGYILSESWAECRTEALESIADYGTVRSEQEIESENWNATWEAESFNPVEVECEDGRKILIRAPHHPAPAADVMDVVVSPQMSFGSGHHHTTRMMCRNILSLTHLGHTLDVGCGTGVLSIVALKAGAEHVDAVDIDPWSTKSASEAAALNAIENKMDVLLGTVEVIVGRTYDTILANINRNIILGDLERYAAALNKGGHLVLSGFLHEDVESIVEACKVYNIELIDKISEEEWVSLKLVNNK
ncbi:MAG: 50S ribosomal protein L11 methyltransferase [Alistipes sp.]|nr:50S ribosomal protein L11 methyltransferase [Alistipes sp.]